MSDNVDSNLSSTTAPAAETPVVIEGTSTGIQGTNGAAITTSLEVTNPSWLDNLKDPTLKSEPCLQNFKGKDLEEVVKSYVSAQKEIGARIRIPGENASAEQKKEFLEKVTKIPGIARMPDPQDPKSLEEFYTKLGRPANPESYKLELPQQIPSDDPVLNQFKQTAFQLGLNQQQTQALVNFELLKQNAAAEAMTAESRRVGSMLKETWGNEFDNKMQSAKEAVLHFSGKYPNEVQALISGPTGNNPVLLQMASELGRLYRENGVIKGEAVSAGNTPEEARSKIKEIDSNRDHPANPLFKGKIGEKERQAAILERSKLYAAAYPDNNS